MSPHHSSSNSTTYTATDSTNHPSASYNINYSVSQPNRVKSTIGSTKTADQGPGINLTSNNNNSIIIYNNGSSHGGSNVNNLPCTVTVSQPAGRPCSGDPVRMIAAAGATSNDHDNCNNNQSKSPARETTSIAARAKAPEEHNRLNNNHIVPRLGDGDGSPSPVPSSLPSPTVSSRSVPRTDDVSIGPDCTTTVDTADTTSTHTTSDTVDQRLPVLNDVRTSTSSRAAEHKSFRNTGNGSSATLNMAACS